MEVFRPELHAYGMRAYIDATRDTLGTAVLDDILQPYGVSLQALEDRNSWVSLEFVQAFLSELVQRSDDPHLLDRAARMGISPKYLGPFYAYFRAFRDTASAYDEIAKATPRFNKTGTYTIEHKGPDRCELRFTPASNMSSAEHTPHMCRIRQVQLATVPNIYDLPPAKVTHTECILRGGACCTYALQWQLKPRHWSAWVGGTLGLATGAVITLSQGYPLWSNLAVMGLMGLGGWAFGHTRKLRHDLSQRVEDLTDHQNALERTLRAHEERFSELLQAKAEVDEKVDQRTLELRHATQRLSQTLEELQALDRAKTDFFNNVSHELRSPLTLILAPVEELAAGRTPPGGQTAAFASMRRNAARLLQLINQLLDLAKIDAGAATTTTAPTDLLSLVRTILDGYQPAADKANVHLVLDAPTTMPSLLGDAAWLESAISNLVANALRLSPPGGEVHILVQDRGSEVNILISDDGPGIAEKDHARIFERFAQTDDNARVGGTGIGLALAREAARLHEGNISVASSPGKGATFTLTLARRLAGPVAPPTPSPEPSSHARMELALMEFEDIGVAPDHATEYAGPTPDAPLAVVVEDDADLRAFMANVLAIRYRVRTACDGVQGLELARTRLPDVVISDVAMPGMGGYALCTALQGDPRTRAIPVLLVTARTQITDVLQGFEAGARDYLLKPFHGRELLARVDVHVKVRRLMQELALRERHAMLGVLAASVAHQVRNPLTTIVSGLPAMRARLQDKLDARTRELVDVMTDCGDRIDRLTLDLMDLSRVDRAPAIPFDPSDGLRAAVRLVRARVPEGVRLEESIEDAPRMHGRAADINHVFLNLLDNAVRAVGTTGTIRVTAAVRDTSFEISVEDTGPGVNTDISDQIFDPFFTTRPAGQGTGLGLTIARQVLTQCGGALRVERAALGGAAFVASLPLHQPHLRGSETP